MSYPLAAGRVNALACPWRTPEYAAAFGPPWEPIEVPAWGSFILTRPIPGTSARDAVGCYPLVGFAPGADIAGGLEQLKGKGLVSIVGVPDPLSSPPLDDLAHHFALCRPYKTHYCVDRRRPPRQLPANHKRKLRKSMGSLHITVGELGEQLDCWCDLYSSLIARHRIRGIAAFSRRFFEKIADHTAFTTIVAWHLGEIVSMALWARGGNAAYYFLGASSPLGYRLSAAYTTMAAAIDHFRDVQWIHLGGGADPDTSRDGLSFFKRGFANTDLVALLCGDILDPHTYAKLSSAEPSATWFPAYRASELTGGGEEASW